MGVWRWWCGTCEVSYVFLGVSHPPKLVRSPVGFIGERGDSSAAPSLITSSLSITSVATVMIVAVGAGVESDTGSDKEGVFVPNVQI